MGKKLRDKFGAYPLVVAQANTKEGKMSAVTLQVQLCEYRQFRHSLARLKYGLPDDEKMRGDPESEGRLNPLDFIAFDKQRKVVTLEFSIGGKKISVDVSVQAACHHRVAERVASMMFWKLREGASKA